MSRCTCAEHRVLVVSLAHSALSRLQSLDAWQIIMMLACPGAMFVMFAVFLSMKLQGSVDWNWAAIFSPLLAFQLILLVAFTLSCCAVKLDSGDNATSVWHGTATQHGMM